MQKISKTQKKFSEDVHMEEFKQIVLQSEGCAARRNFAIVTILAYAGLRTTECLNLRKSDICLESSQLNVANGKGEKARMGNMYLK